MLWLEHRQSNMVSPFASHQQQIAMLAHQQQIAMLAAAVQAGANPKIPVNTQLPVPNGTPLPVQSWPNMGYQIPGMMINMGAQVEQLKSLQVDCVTF